MIEYYLKMNFLTILLFFGGLGLLVFGAECLVRGASRIAIALKVSPLVVGLTVVAFGTSSPELAVSAISAFKGQATIALGNVVGSNFFNILVILGITALISPLRINPQIIRFDLPWMIFSSLLLMFLSFGLIIGRFEGLLLTSALIVYLWLMIRINRRKRRVYNLELEEIIKSSAQKDYRITKNIVFIVIGLVLLYFGSEWLIGSAIKIARFMGIDELIIALTLVAGGTSLPEAATSVVAAIRKERDIAVGNIIGSNIFNVFSVLGLSALCSPRALIIQKSFFSYHLPLLIFVSVLCLLIFYSQQKIARKDGAYLFGLYLYYLLYMLLQERGADLFPLYQKLSFWLFLFFPAALYAYRAIGIFFKRHS